MITDEELKQRYGKLCKHCGHMELYHRQELPPYVQYNQPLPISHIEKFAPWAGNCISSDQLQNEIIRPTGRIPQIVAVVLKGETHWSYVCSCPGFEEGGGHV